MAKPPVETTLTWRGNLEFDASSGAHTVRIDSNGTTGASPTSHLAFALAGCMAVDVVMILTKGRHEVSDLEVRLKAIRAEGPPAYFTDVTLHYVLKGTAPEDAVQRAIDLSRDKYCSVLHTLRPDLKLTITHEIAAA